MASIRKSVRRGVPTATQQGAAPDRLQLRSFLATLPAAGELGRCGAAYNILKATMRNNQNPKTKHHFLPQFYLKGFADKQVDPHVWQYERGAIYCPSIGSNSRNPQRTPVSRAAMIPYLYSYTDKNGTTEYERIENELEKLEKPHDDIIRKIRAKQLISESEKNLFSRYIDMMMRRVPSGIKWSQELSHQALQHLKPEVRRNIPYDWEAKRKAEGASQEEITRELPIVLGLLEAALNDYEKEMPYEALLLGLLRPVSPVSEYISKMRWQYFTAPPYSGFFTGDNPVVLSKVLGIRSSRAEIVFPISTEVALVISNHMEIEERFVAASSGIVQEINYRIADTATYFLYAARKVENYVKMLSSSRDSYNPIYDDIQTSLILRPQIDF